MADPRTERNAVLGATLVKKLQARAFDAYYCATKEEALQQALALIPKGDVISWGGSVSIAEIGLLDYVRKNFKCIDRDTAKTPEERMGHDNGRRTGKHRRERQPLRRHDLRPEAGHRHRRAE